MSVFQLTNQMNWAFLQLVKKFPTFYRTQKFYYYLHNSPILVPIFSQINLVSALPFYSFENCFLCYSIYTCFLPRGLFLSDCSTKILKELFFSYVRSTCPTHILFLNFIIEWYFVRSTSHEGHQQLPFAILSRIEGFVHFRCFEIPQSKIRTSNLNQGKLQNIIATFHITMKIYSLKLKDRSKHFVK